MPNSARQEAIDAAADLLRDAARLKTAMLDVITDWNVSTAVNLSNRSRNRRAWLGQAACCLLCGATEEETKLGWHQLTASEQAAANAIADDCIGLWESWHLNSGDEHAEEGIGD